MTYRHRAGVRPYTSTCVFARSCVFDKQLLLPIYCGLQKLASSEAPLIANVRGHFAEFLNQCSPERLSMLYSPTCVSFSTVSLNITLPSFSWGLGRRLPEHAVPLARRGFPSPRSPLQPRPWFSTLKKLRNIDLTPIVYAFRPRLRNRLTLGGITFPRKP